MLMRMGTVYFKHLSFAILVDDSFHDEFCSQKSGNFQNRQSIAFDVTIRCVSQWVILTHKKMPNLVLFNPKCVTHIQLSSALK